MRKFDARTKGILEDQVSRAMTKAEAEQAEIDIKKAYVAGLLTQEELDFLIPLLNASQINSFAKRKYMVSETVQSIISNIESGAYEIAKYLIDKFTPLGIFDLLNDDDATIAEEILVKVFGTSLGVITGTMFGAPIIGAIIGSGVIEIVKDQMLKILDSTGMTPVGRGGDKYYSTRTTNSLKIERRRHNHFMRDPMDSLSMEEDRMAGILRAPLASLSMAEKAQLLADSSTPEAEKERLKDSFGNDLADSIENNPNKAIDLILRKTGVTELIEPIRARDWNQLASVIVKHWVPFIGLGYVLSFVGVPFLATKLIGGAGWIGFLEVLERRAKNTGNFQMTFSWE